MQKFLKIFSLLLLLFLGSCSRHHYRSSPYTLYQTDLSQNINEAAQTDALAFSEICNEPWWFFFEDPQLTQFIELSLACHPNIRVAEARIQRACQEARIARSALWPHLFGVGELARQKISKLGPGFVPGFPELFTDTTLELTTASYELDIWQKNSSIYRAALDEMQAEIADYEEARLLLSTTIAAVYFDLQMKLSRKTITEERLKARQELYTLLKQRYSSGVNSQFRLYEVDTEVQILKDMLLRIEGEIAIDNHALAALVSNVACLCGQTGELTILPSAQFNRPFPLPETLSSDLLHRRPDLTAQKWRVEAACFEIKAARANFFPRIDLMGWLGTQSIKVSELFTGKTLIALAEGAVTIPLFLAGKLHAELGVAQEDLELAVAGYNQTVLRAVQQVSDALTDLTTADARKKVLSDSVKAAKHLFDLTKQKVTNGVDNRLSLLNSIENLLIQEDLEVQAQLNRFEAAVELIFAIGGGYYDCRCS